MPKSYLTKMGASASLQQAATKGVGDQNDKFSVT